MDHPKDTSFQVSVKGLFLKRGKVMMIQQDDGLWELPGGRVQKGENLIACLKRECLEETGLRCRVLGTRPQIVYSTVDKADRARVMVCYRVTFPHLRFRPSDECVAIAFYTKDQIRKLPLVRQLKKLPSFL